MRATNTSSSFKFGELRNMVTALEISSFIKPNLLPMRDPPLPVMEHRLAASTLWNNVACSRSDCVSEADVPQIRTCIGELAPRTTLLPCDWGQTWAQPHPVFAVDLVVKRRRINVCILFSGPGGRRFKSSLPICFKHLNS